MIEKRIFYVISKKMMVIKKMIILNDNKEIDKFNIF